MQRKQLIQNVTEPFCSKRHSLSGVPIMKISMKIFYFILFQLNGRDFSLKFEQTYSKHRLLTNTSTKGWKNVPARGQPSKKCYLREATRTLSFLKSFKDILLYTKQANIFYYYLKAAQQIQKRNSRFFSWPHTLALYPITKGLKNR